MRTCPTTAHRVVNKTAFSHGMIESGSPVEKSTNLESWRFPFFTSPHLPNLPPPPPRVSSFDSCPLSHSGKLNWSIFERSIHLISFQLIVCALTVKKNKTTDDSMLKVCNWFPLSVQVPAMFDISIIGRVIFDRFAFCSRGNAVKG